MAVFRGVAQPKLKRAEQYFGSQRLLRMLREVILKEEAAPEPILHRKSGMVGCKLKILIN